MNSQRLKLPWPPSLSACFTNVKGRGRVPTKTYKAWTTEALWGIASQRPQRFTGEVSIWIGLVAPDKCSHDADNRLKATLDVLTKSGVIMDDSNKYVRRLSVEWLASGDPCTVLIQNFEG